MRKRESDEYSSGFGDQAAGSGLGSVQKSSAKRQKKVSSSNTQSEEDYQQLQLSLSSSMFRPSPFLARRMYSAASFKEKQHQLHVKERPKQFCPKCGAQAGDTVCCQEVTEASGLFEEEDQEPY